MTSQTLKLQLLSVAVLVSVLSVGASFLMILASGCWQCKPVVSDGSANKQLHVTHSSPLGGEWQSLYHTPPQHSNKKLMSELVGKKREQETTSHPLTARYSAVKRVATVAREGNGATDLLENSQSKAVDMGFRETEENDSHSVPKPVQATQKHRRLSKKRLQAIKALSHDNSVLSDLHLSMARRRRNVSHQNLHSPGRNGSSHHMHTGSSQHSIHSNSTASFKLVPGDQQSAVVLTDLCSDPASQCNEFLPPEEQLLYRSCEAKSVKWHNDRKDGLCQCQFMNTTGHSRVALVSLPGSGNTWLRGLLERATSVCTGSLFCDKTLRAGGMCGEGLREGVLVVKTHDTRLQWTNVAYRNGMWSDTRPFFDAAIVLVRSPFRALIAEWNRQNAYRFSSGQMGNSHVKYLESSKFFLENRKWDQFVNEQIRKWKMIISENTIKNKYRRHPCPVLVVYYEQLKTNHLLQVRKVLDFLRFPFSEKELTSAVKAGFSSYYRNHTDSFQHFTQQQRTVVNTAISEAVMRLRVQNFTEMANHLHTYLDVQ